MKLLLAAMMLSVLVGCVVYRDGPHDRHRDGSWHSQQGNDDDQGDRGHRGHGDHDD